MGIKDGKKSFVSFFDMQVVKLAITIYFVVITAIISNYTSKEFYELLWPNERVAIVIFMTVSLLVPYFYMQYIKKQDGFKTLIIYHMVMIFAALVMIMPYEFRPYVAIALFGSPQGRMGELPGLRPQPKPSPSSLFFSWNHTDSILSSHPLPG